MNEECLFCRIVDGELPAWKVYEDGHFLAFLDVNPASKGHVLVIPKEHYPGLLDMSEHDLRHVMKVVQEVASAVVEATDADGFNILQSNNPVAGQQVFHVHFHIIPRNHGDNVEIEWDEGDLIEDEAEDLLKEIKECM